MASSGDGPFVPDGFAQLVERSRSGDNEAAGELLAGYRDYLLLIANGEFDRSIQAHLGPSDIVQQSMLAARQKLAQFRGETEPEFRGWLRQILRNDIRDANRKYRDGRLRAGTSEADSGRPVASDPIDHANTPGTDAMVREQAELLNQAMQRLPPRYQEVIRQRNWNEHSFEEIGERMGCSPEAARKLWYRAIVRLQGVLGRQDSSLAASPGAAPQTDPKTPDSNG
jgi:RNA polymerase sigma-70 factor (ECF subfamily)